MDCVCEVTMAIAAIQQYYLLPRDMIKLCTAIQLQASIDTAGIALCNCGVRVVDTKGCMNGDSRRLLVRTAGDVTHR